jgi:hypothetical protein
MIWPRGSASTLEPREVNRQPGAILRNRDNNMLTGVVS